jgi:CheY-like chemotaxis protein
VIEKSTNLVVVPQARRNADRTQGGLGIGLNLARRLIDLPGGTLTAASPGTDKGSSFIVRMHVTSAEGHKAASVASETANQSSTNQRFKVLVVDDNVDAAESLSMLLQNAGHTSRVAHDGYQALQVAQKYQPTVVFLDIGLPGMNGYEVAKALRKIPGMEQVVLVALTGWGGRDDRDRSNEAGIHTHLIKPIGIGTVDKLLSSFAVAADRVCE